MNNSCCCRLQFELYPTGPAVVYNCIVAAVVNCRYIQLAPNCLGYSTFKFVGIVQQHPTFDLLAKRVLRYVFGPLGRNPKGTLATFTSGISFVTG